MDMEWAKDGKTGELYIVQARPETVQSKKQRTQGTILETFKLNEKSQVLITGRSVGDKIGAGKVHVIKDVADLGELQEGEILVTDKTDPDWEPAMKKAAAVVTNRGGRTCHAAIVCRELGLPAIVGTENATEVLKDGQYVTISCCEGETGFVYEGKLNYTVEAQDLSLLSQSKTKIMMIVGNPEEAYQQSFLPNSGVGLARMEFIISSYIKVHPMALVKFDQLKDEASRRAISELTKNYANKSDFFIEKLRRGLPAVLPPK
jgi:pyruvate,water dikinase